MDEALRDSMLDTAGVDDDEAEVIRGRIVSAHEIGSSEGQICKVDGCPSDWIDSRGRYAKLCGPHKEAARRAAADQRASNDGYETPPGLSVAGNGSQRPSRGTEGVDLVKLAEALKAPAKRFQKALAAKKATKQEAVDALEEFSASLKAIQAAAQTAIEEAR